MALAALQLSELLIRRIRFSGGTFCLNGQVVLEIMSISLPDQDMFMGNEQSARCVPQNGRAKLFHQGYEDSTSGSGDDTSAENS
jgi:hypothetical protein